MPEDDKTTHMGYSNALRLSFFPHVVCFPLCSSVFVHSVPVSWIKSCISRLSNSISVGEQRSLGHVWLKRNKQCVRDDSSVLKLRVWSCVVQGDIHHSTCSKPLPFHPRRVTHTQAVTTIAGWLRIVSPSLSHGHIFFRSFRFFLTYISFPLNLRF